jgi:hypothetical protein
MQQTRADERDAELARSAARQRVMLGAIVAGVSVAALFYFFKGTPAMPGSVAAVRELFRPREALADDLAPPAADGPGPAPSAPAATAGREVASKFPPGGSPEKMLQVARAAKDAGFTLMGVTQCVWTRRQRELFGGADSPARKLLESIYVECRSREDCPNVRGYPTWARGERQFPGFRDLDAIAAIVKDAAQEPRVQMLQMAPEPTEDVLPEDRAAVQAPPPPAQPAEPAAGPAAAGSAAAGSAPAARSELDAMIRSVAGEVVQEMLRERGAPGREPIVEKVRGVSAYPPLNVPNMPGTAPFDLATSRFVDQASQELDEATVALAQQMAFTFEQIAFDNTRDPNSSDFATVALPQASYVSASGNPLADKRVVSS